MSPELTEVVSWQNSFSELWQLSSKMARRAMSMESAMAFVMAQSLRTETDSVLPRNLYASWGGSFEEVTLISVNMGSVLAGGCGGWGWPRGSGQWPVDFCGQSPQIPKPTVVMMYGGPSLTHAFRCGQTYVAPVTIATYFFFKYKMETYYTQSSLYNFLLLNIFV